MSINEMRMAKGMSSSANVGMCPEPIIHDSPENMRGALDYNANVIKSIRNSVKILNCSLLQGSELCGEEDCLKEPIQEPICELIMKQSDMLGEIDNILDRLVKQIG